MDIVLRDADRGLVDFPSIRDGEEEINLPNLEKPL